MWQLYVVGLIIGVATLFFDVSNQSFIPLLVPKSEIGQANSRLEATSQLAALIAPGFDGMLMKVIAAPLVLFSDVLGYFISAICLIKTHDHEQEKPMVRQRDEKLHLYQEISEGIAFVWRSFPLRMIAISTAVSNLTFSMGLAVIPIIVMRFMGIDVFSYSLIVVFGGIGGLLGAMSATRLKAAIGEAPTIIGGMLIASVGGMLTPIATLCSHRVVAFWLLIFGEVVMTFGVLVYNLTQVTMRQRLCPQQFLGRMNATMRFIVWGIIPVGALVGGWLGSRWGEIPTLWFATMFGGLAAIPLLFLPGRIPVEE